MKGYSIVDLTAYISPGVNVSASIPPSMCSLEDTVLL